MDNLEIDWVIIQVDERTKFDPVVWLESVLKHAQQIDTGEPCCEQDSSA